MNIKLIHTVVFVVLLGCSHEQVKAVAESAAARRLKTIRPILTQVTLEEDVTPQNISSTPLTPLGAPLEFISPSIRAFQTSVEPQQLTTKNPILTQAKNRAVDAQQNISSTPLTPLAAPRYFISPSIRAFQIGASLPQEQKITPFTYGLSGYIKNEAFADTAQVLGERENEYLFYPLRPVFDCCGNNVNRKGSFNMVAIESRVRGEVAGPYVFGANSYGIAEVDAWATSTFQLGLLRIRHVFLYFEWKDKSLLMGQYWHPLQLPECYADVIAFNGGTPFDPFAREPQVRLTKQFDTMTCILAAGAHANSPYDGPNGLDTIYARNGVLPNINIQFFSSIRTHICGVGVDCTRLVPRLITHKNFRAHESLTSWVAMAFAAFNWERLGIRTKFIYAQNGFPYGLLSGYAVHSIDPYTDERTYTNTQCLNAWLDTAYKGEVEPGLFVGVSKNIGATRSIIQTTKDEETNQEERLVYAGDQQDIDLLFRVQPRVRWFIKPFVFGAELELTSAKYGTVTDTARVINAKLVNNFRLLLAAFYVF